MFWKNLEIFLKATGSFSRMLKNELLWEQPNVFDQKCENIKIHDQITEIALDY